MASPLVRAGLLIGLDDYVEKLGGSFAQVLERAGLEEEQIRNPNHFHTAGKGKVRGARGGQRTSPGAPH